MSKRDIFVVVPDLDAENVIKTLLTQRQESLGISLNFTPAPPPSGDLLRYFGRDAGCFYDAVKLLRPPQRTHRHAMILFDWHGSGRDTTPPTDIEREVETQLWYSGWTESNAAVIVLEPELEAWVWADSVEVANTLGWSNDKDGLREHLSGKDLWRRGQTKPQRPKEAMREAVRVKRTPGGTAPLFARLAEKVSVQDCRDRAFNRFREVLRRWFPRQSSG